MVNKQQVYQALDRVAKSGLINSRPEDMVLIALVSWHEGFVPEVAWARKLDQKSQLVVGYLAEFFAGFNVLCHEEREKLLQFSEKLKPSIPQLVEPDEYRDELASEWGLEYDITPYFEHLSHYQTRHYKHKSNYKRPSPNFTL
ncbi:hypothetical protein ACJJI4_12965 [Microbulbifer sp. TRSA002]|uniref:hypothetical protein n=1 Tax=Microbulbifer sp. TRSA002 TaxID=3243382 RepID=UPI004039131E